MLTKHEVIGGLSSLSMLELPLSPLGKVWVNLTPGTYKNQIPSCILKGRKQLCYSLVPAIWGLETQIHPQERQVLSSPVCPLPQLSWFMQR